MSFAAFFISALALMNGTIAFVAASKVKGNGLAIAFFYLFFTLLFVLEIIPPLMRWSSMAETLQNNLTISPLVISAAFLATGFSSILFFYTLAGEMVGLVARRISYPVFSVFASPAVFWMALTAALITLLVGYSNTRSPGIYRTEIKVRNLPPSLEGMTIAHLSDLHIGHFGDETYIQDVVSQTMMLRPDLIVLTGDQTDAPVKDSLGIVPHLIKLQAPFGVYAISGNHDHYIDYIAWKQKWKELGLRTLSNEHVVIRKDADALALGGIPDPAGLRFLNGEKPDIEKAFQNAPANSFKLLLAHHPAFFTKAKDLNIDLQLSGHTHNGQYFPFTLIARLAHRYVSGLYEEGDSVLYVNKGTGFWGPPLRTGGRGEIALLTLSRKN